MEIPRQPPAPDGPDSAPSSRRLVTLRDGRVSSGATTLLSISSLEINAGERIVITGPSGSGKTLLLATLTGRWAVGLTFSGERHADLAAIGFVPQRGLDALHPLLPIGRQLSAVSEQPSNRVAEVLDAVGLTDPALRRRRPTEISGGQAQRAAVALAVLTGSPLILADEPTSALDPDSRALMIRLLTDVLAEHQTLVVSTHDPVVAESLGGRRLQVSHGRVHKAAPRPAHPAGAASSVGAIAREDRCA